jgi:hypothetical protein
MHISVCRMQIFALTTTQSELRTCVTIYHLAVLIADLQSGPALGSADGATILGLQKLEASKIYVVWYQA